MSFIHDQAGKRRAQLREYHFLQMTHYSCSYHVPIDLNHGCRIVLILFPTWSIKIQYIQSTLSVPYKQVKTQSIYNSSLKPSQFKSLHLSNQFAIIANLNWGPSLYWWTPTQGTFLDSPFENLEELRGFTHSSFVTVTHFLSSYFPSLPQFLIPYYSLFK